MSYNFFLFLNHEKSEVGQHTYFVKLKISQASSLHTLFCISFSTFWLRASVVSVLISFTADSGSMVHMLFSNVVQNHYPFFQKCSSSSELNYKLNEMNKFAVHSKKYQKPLQQIYEFSTSQKNYMNNSHNSLKSTKILILLYNI